MELNKWLSHLLAFRFFLRCFGSGKNCLYRNLAIFGSTITAIIPTTTGKLLTSILASKWFSISIIKNPSSSKNATTQNAAVPPAKPITKAIAKESILNRNFSILPYHQILPRLQIVVFAKHGLFGMCFQMGVNNTSNLAHIRALGNDLGGWH